MLEQKKKQKILIADDSEMNRELLIEMLQDQYELLEAENGLQAVEILTDQAEKISLVLLDLLMPEMDGFEVLAVLNRYRWIEEVPVIVISAETAPACIDRAYELGVMDFITRPFNIAVVHHRVENALLLFAKQRKMTSIIADQLYKNKQNSRLMISVLSHIVEFRNGESGMHVTHIGVITSLLLRFLRQREKNYGVSAEKADLITTASSLHDIGKIAIPAEILNKPGKLTPEEFEIMRSHSMLGAKMLHDLPEYQRNTPLVQIAYEICRWHHERYDGGGYPDGLKGDEIPISAQVVSLADVYDALTSERCYKKAFSHESALNMIFDGQCGAFNPVLLDCLREIAPILPGELLANSQFQNGREDTQSIAEQMRNYGLISSEHILETDLMERQKTHFFSEQSNEMFFFYINSPSMITFNHCAAERLGVSEVVNDPFQGGNLEALLGVQAAHMGEKRDIATPGSPDFSFSTTLTVDGEPRPCLCTCHAIWADDDYQGAVGKLELKDQERADTTLPHSVAERLKKLETAIRKVSGGELDVILEPQDSDDEIGALVGAFRDMVEGLKKNLNDLNDCAYRDGLTLVKNRAAYQLDTDKLDSQIKSGEECSFAVAVLDVNYLKYINNNYGHVFGDEVIVQGCQLVCRVFNHSPVYRIGGDEFVVIMRNGDYDDRKKLVEEFRQSMVEIDCGDGTMLRMPVSLGLAEYDPERDRCFRDVFSRADALMYQNKLNIKSAYPPPVPAGNKS